jgi:cell division cycle protein 37
MRKMRIAQLKADIACNDVLQPRLVQIAADVASKGPAEFSTLVDRFKNNPSPESPPTNAPQQPTYDGMLLSLMLSVWEKAKEEGTEKDDPALGEKLVSGLRKHVELMKVHQEKLKKDLEQEEAEQKKKITSDDIHEGFESKVKSLDPRQLYLQKLMLALQYIPAKPEPAPIKNAIPPSSSTKATKTEFEVINPKGVAAATSSSKSADNNDGDDGGATELPEMTPSLEAFSHLPLRAYEQSWEFIKQHRDVIVPGASDALLVAAFTAQNEGKSAYARQCIHQSLLLQYCDKLGKDGVSIFFRKCVPLPLSPSHISYKHETTHR